MIKLLIDILGIEQLILLGVTTIIGVILSVIILSLKIDYLRGRRKWD